MRKFLATTAAGLALATGSVAIATLSPIGIASAQDGTPSTQTQPAEGERQGRHPRRALAKAAIKHAAETIGIPASDLVTELKAGKSIAEVATAHGVAPQTVIDDLVAAATARIDQAVAEGKLDAAKAAEIKTKLPERVTNVVNKKFDGTHRKGGAKAPAATPAA